MGLQFLWRGQVNEMYSDNHISFTSDREELRDAILEWNKENIHNSLLQKNIKWSFSPLCGSHFGGIWERRIQGQITPIPKGSD